MKSTGSGKEQSRNVCLMPVQKQKQMGYIQTDGFGCIFFYMFFHELQSMLEKCVLCCGTRILAVLVPFIHDRIHRNKEEFQDSIWMLECVSELTTQLKESYFTEKWDSSYISLLIPGNDLVICLAFRILNFTAPNPPKAQLSNGVTIKFTNTYGR